MWSHRGLRRPLWVGWGHLIRAICRNQPLCSCWPAGEHPGAAAMAIATQACCCLASRAGLNLFFLRAATNQHITRHTPSLSCSAVAGAVSRSITAPIDRVKILYQVRYFYFTSSFIFSQPRVCALACMGRSKFCRAHQQVEPRLRSVWFAACGDVKAQLKALLVRHWKSAWCGICNAIKPLWLRWTGLVLTRAGV